MERHWGASGQAAGQAVQGKDLHPAPCTLHPAPCTLHPMHPMHPLHPAGGGQGGPRVGVTRNVVNIPIIREGVAGGGAGGGASGGEKRKKKRDQLMDFGLGQIEKRCPKVCQNAICLVVSVKLTAHCTVHNRRFHKRAHIDITVAAFIYISNNFTFLILP